MKYLGMKKMKYELRYFILRDLVTVYSKVCVTNLMTIICYKGLDLCLKCRRKVYRILVRKYLQVGRPIKKLENKLKVVFTKQGVRSDHGWGFYVDMAVLCVELPGSANH